MERDRAAGRGAQSSQADSDPLTGIAHGHHGDQIKEGEGESEPRSGLSAAEGDQAYAKDQAAHRIHKK